MPLKTIPLARLLPQLKAIAFRIGDYSGGGHNVNDKISSDSLVVGRGGIVAPWRDVIRGKAIEDLCFAVYESLLNGPV